MDKSEGKKIVSTNRKAHFNYFLSDFLECGISLEGSEIKSLRSNGCNINDAYVIFDKGEAFVINMQISRYEKGGAFSPDERRDRKLLLHKREILKYSQKVAQDGYTLIPVYVYFKKGLAKMSIALGKGKKNFDKRETIKKRDDERRIAKAMKR